MSGTWASDWALNDIVTVSEFRKGMGCVADLTLGISAASFDFTGLPTTYAHLMIVGYVRCDTAAVAVDSLLLRFNNDSATNYQTERLDSTGSTVAGTAPTASSSATIGVISAATASAGAFSGFSVLIPNYANGANFKTAITSSGVVAIAASSNAYIRQSAARWDSNAGINRLTFLTGGNFVAGSRISIYVMGS